MSAVLPAGKNWILNPSVETNLTGVNAEFGSTITRDNARAWDGQWSTKVVCPGAGGSEGVRYSTGLGLALAGAHSVVAQVRMSGNGVSLDQLFLVVFYTDATSENTAIIDPPTLTEGWTTVTSAEITTNAAKTIDSLKVAIHNAAAVAQTYWVDGVDLRIDEPIDVYLAGDQGPTHSWLGTAHGSASIRAASTTLETTGSGGVVTVSASVYRADKLNAIGDLLGSRAGEGVVTAGTVEVDVDRAIKGTCKLISNDPNLLTAYSYVAPFLRLTYEDGTIDERQVGLFRLEQPSVTQTNTGAVVEASGFDLTRVLALSSFADTYSIAAGANLATAVRTIIEATGLTRHSIPDTGRVAPTEGYSWKPGTSRLEAVNDLLNAAACYTIYASADGRLTSLPYRSLAQVQPARTYPVGTSGAIIGDIVSNTNDAQLANVVIVVRQDPTKAVLSATRRHTDPRSPSSTVNLGEITRVITLNDVVDQAAVDARATQEIELRSVFVSATLEVLPDSGFAPHSTIALTVPTDRADLTDLAGRWWVKSYGFGLTPATATARLAIRRLESYA